MVTNIITNSVKVGIREINIGPMHTFIHIASSIHQNCDRIFPYLAQIVFLCICRYAPGSISFNF